MSNTNNMEEILKENTDSYFYQIKDPALQGFVAEALTKYGSADKFYEAEDIINTAMDMFEHMNLVNEQAESGWLQPIIAAGYIHNLFYSSEQPVTSIFMAREKLSDAAKASGIMDSWADLVFQTVEGQLGPKTPIPACAPHGDHPIQIFAWARWFVKRGVI